MKTKLILTEDPKSDSNEIALFRIKCIAKAFVAHPPSSKRYYEQAMRDIMAISSGTDVVDLPEKPKLKELTPENAKHNSKVLESILDEMGGTFER